MTEDNVSYFINFLGVVIQAMQTELVAYPRFNPPSVTHLLL